MTKLLTRAMLLATTASMAVTTLPVPAAFAQGYNQPPPDYQDQPPPDYQNQPPPDYRNQPPPQGGDYDNGYDNGYDGDQGPPPGYDDYVNQAPQGYDPSQPPPPPPGYQGAPMNEDQQRADAAYATAAQQWAAENCVRSGGGNVAAGAVIGGIFGALIGAGVSGRGSGAAVGAAIGGASGAAIAAGQQGATSPGCPPGYVLRGGAGGFYYGGGPFLYAAPAWYNPWIWYGGSWLYRPYPYHAWYARHYGWRHGYRRHWR